MGLSDVITAQEAITMLRDRLKAMSSDLVEARSRISGLEATLKQDQQTIRNLSVQVSALGMYTTSWALPLRLDLDLDSGEITKSLFKVVEKTAKEPRDASFNGDKLEAGLADARERYFQTMFSS